MKISKPHTHTHCKILNFPPKCICVLGLLPLIFSTWGSYHLTEPPHKDTVLVCPGCLWPIKLCPGHQRLLAKAGNSKFYRVQELEMYFLHLEMLLQIHSNIHSKNIILLWRSTTPIDTDRQTCNPATLPCAQVGSHSETGFTPSLVIHS